MCERCPALIEELLLMDSELDEEGAVNVLWSFTAFPFSSFEHSAQQAREHVARVVHERGPR
jgi:hypothetical protein